MVTLFDKGPNETSEGEALLTFEKALEVPERPLVLAWAPDNRHIAIHGGPVRIFDVDNPAGSGQLASDNIGPAEIAWSPDGAMLAISQMAPVGCVRVIDTESGREIVRRETSLQQRYQGFLFTNKPLIFTLDGQSLWVANDKVFPGHHADSGIALKLDIRTLEALDCFDAPLPMAGERTSFENFSFSHDNGSTQLLYTASAILLSPERYFAYGYDLETKSELFPKIPIAEDNRSGFFREPRQLLMLPDKRSLLVRLDTGISGRPGVLHNPQFDRQVEVYNVQSGKLIAHYLGLVGAKGGDPMQPGIDAAEFIAQYFRVKGSNVEQGGVGDVNLSGNLLLGYWSSASLRRGGLVALDPLTGIVRQRIIGEEAVAIALSPDGKRLALVTRNHGVRFYSVN